MASRKTKRTEKKGMEMWQIFVLICIACGTVLYNLASIGLI